jgi:hypothetical protein
MLLITLAPRTTAIATALLIAQQLISDPGWTIYNINQITMRQANAPAGVLGRVTAAEHFGSLLATLVASIVAGIVADTAGARFALALGAGCMFAGGFIILASSVRDAA